MPPVGLTLFSAAGRSRGALACQAYPRADRSRNGKCDLCGEIAAARAVSGRIRQLQNFVSQPPTAPASHSLWLVSRNKP